ncbi:MAG: hypothetical protein LBC76_10470 [Treponema sp.]|nr:hypothetical protein [Treponema sp.]
MEDFLEYKIYNDFYHEIWALYSLPFWIDDIKQTDTFLANALLGLASNGNFRIYPIPHVNQGNDYLKIIKKFAENFTMIFPKAQCKFNKYLGTDTVVFNLPHSKEGMNEWLEKNYKRKRNIIEIILDALPEIVKIKSDTCLIKRYNKPTRSRKLNNMYWTSRTNNLPMDN